LWFVLADEVGVGAREALRVLLTVGVLLASTGASVALAQSAPPAGEAAERSVALWVTGAESQTATSAFVSFVPVASDLRFDGSPAELPAVATMLVSIDTGVPQVRVLRRHDGLVLERRFDGHEDGYALAVVASELLEVARSGGDPASVGATVVEASAIETSLADSTAADPNAAESGSVDLDANAAGEETQDVEVVDPESVEPHGSTRSWALEGTVGIGVEGWLSIDQAPLLIQPTLFGELLAGVDGEAWRVGGGVFVSALGAYGFEGGGFEGSYARHDFGARVTGGGDLGELRTRLLGHLRVGGAVVVGSARPQGDDDDESAVRPGWFVGLGLDVRQPLVEGLEVFLEASVDVLPAAVRFTGGGTTLVREPTVRLGARAGLGWRFR